MWSEQNLGSDAFFNYYLPTLERPETSESSLQIPISISYPFGAIVGSRELK